MNLKSKILFVFISLVFLAIFSVGLLSYLVAQNTLLVQARQKLTAVAELKVAQINDLIKTKLDRITDFADSDIISDNMLKHKKGEQTDIKWIISYLKRRAELDMDVEELMLLDSSGVVSFTTGGTEVEIDRSKDMYFTNAKEKAYFKKPYFSETLNKSNYTVSAPIFHRQNNEFVGVIVARMNMRKLYQFASNYVGLGTTGETLLGSKVGDDVVFVTPLRFDRDAAFKRKVALGSYLARPVIESASGRDGVEVSIDYRGIAIEAVYRYIAIADLGMVAKIDINEIKAPAFTLRNCIIVIGIAVMLIVVILTYFFSVSISRPIIKLSDNAKTLAEGHLKQQISFDRTDEIGELGSSLNSMIKAWKEIIKKIMDSSTKLSSSSAEIAAATEEMSQGADSQMSQVIKTSSGMEEMSGSIQEVSKNAKSTSDTAIAASKLSKEGSEKVRNTVDGISIANKTIINLNERTQAIGKVIQLIGEIAAQTNILALNAAIEAARAGEHGKGFDVVAEEIRKLAQRTTQSTAEISEIVEEIQRETQDAARIMDSGTNMANEAGQVLDDIVEGIVSTTDMVQMISAASIQQAKTSEQIAESLQNISNVSKQTAQASREVAKSSQDLTILAEQLDEVTKQFKL
ncbi:methyl-accepting chemotaxis protein [Candidatus Magnetomoraceae bacterium gMMP-15]